MRLRILVSLLSLAVICFGVRYAVGREGLRNPNHLHVLYQETNKEFFDGKLPDADFRVYSLSDENAEGITYREIEGRFVIVLDPNWNTSKEESLDTIRHEACHAATWGEEPDAHGPRLQECMKRFEVGK